MANRITRERMIEAIRELPEDATVDDAIERLVSLTKIEEGLAQVDRGDGVPHQEVMHRARGFLKGINTDVPRDQD